jgi:hypothetical protein
MHSPPPGGCLRVLPSTYAKRALRERLKSLAQNSKKWVTPRVTTNEGNTKKVTR